MKNTDIVNLFIFLLFLLSGAAAGWIGVDLLPYPTLSQVDDIEDLRIIIAAFGIFYGILSGFFFQ